MTNTKYDSFFAKNNILKNSVLVNVNTFEQASIAKEAGVTGVIVMFDKEYQMANISLVIKIVKELKIYCAVQIRNGHALEAHLLQECGVNLFNECITNNTSDVSNLNYNNYNIPFLCKVSSLEECLNCIENNCFTIKNDNSSLTVSQLIDQSKEINEKIIEFNKFKNFNSIMKYSKEHQISVDLLNVCSEAGKIPCIQLAEGVIKNPLDVILLLKEGYDGVILNEEIFDTRFPLLILKTIVQAVHNHDNNQQILDSCILLYDV